MLSICNNINFKTSKLQFHRKSLFKESISERRFKETSNIKPLTTFNIFFNLYLF